MNKSIKYFILITSLFICVISLFSTTSEKAESDFSYPAEEFTAPQDTGTLYPVKNTQITNYNDLIKKSPIDLKDPSNVQTQVEYDIKHNVYLFRTKIDNDEWVTPFTLNPQQYLDYSLKESMSRYFKQKNDETFNKKDEKEAFSLKDIKVNAGALERIFGPGGVQVKTQGYVELSMGLKNTSTDNPTLSQKNRNRTMFDFDEKIQVNVNASVGDKVNFGLNYDTEATFDFDSKKAKLAYEGKEDEIIRYLEAGNVSMNTTNSLITGATSLFGIRADLQFGKLKINTVISQKETQSQTASSSGGVQTTPFEFKADEYDENQHFFLSQYFRDNYDEAMSKLPYIQSPILITKIEVWVTNKQGNWDNARNIVAFADMGEYNKIGNTGKWNKQGTLDIPYNGANNLYSTINSSYSAARNKDQANAILTAAGLQTGQDFDKLENARKLDASEYTLNTKLGYISLNSALASDQVLAVAFEYTKGPETYKIGEFASEIPSQEGSAAKSGSLFLKLLKPVSLYPQSYTWDLMMKNVYKLGSIQIQKEKFRLNIAYQSDTVGTYINYIPEGNIKNQLLLRVMNLDRLNASNNANPDGIFDFLDGYTINAERGRVIFPVVEPFGEHLRKKIGNDAIAKKYVYQELYDSTLTVAQQTADKNKFKISGSFRASASSSSVISLNAMNVTKGSVKVTANGTVLTENVDYSVDYIAGTVTILNQSLIDTGTSINVSLEDQSLFSMQRQTLLGLNLSYDFTKNFNVGATILHMYEKPLTYKSSVGEEALKNTVWGLNTSYRTKSQWLTNLIDKLPFVNATAPSEISLNAEFAQMIPGHYENQYSGGYSYIDDFEAAKTRISLVNAYGWKLSSTPTLFEESKLTNDIAYGNNRARLAWFNIDNLFTRNTSRTPSHITKEDRDNPFVREINIKEIYPGKDIVSTEASTLTALNLSFYPTERGPYNLDDVSLNSDGQLLNPQNRWGGITRKLDNTNFENSNIEYIEFWLLDPFVENGKNNVNNTGGDLYFNLGEISEDVLKDGKKFFENGLPTDPLSTEYETTKWGRVPTRQSTAYAFDNTLSNEARARQDVGLNGLSTADELQFPTYVTYLNNLRSKLSSSAISKMEQDPFSPLNDPSGDNYHYYRGSDYDAQKTSILDRYKYFNGTEGNTITNTNESYSTAASSVPDVEDLNQDYTMNESDNYYQYKVKLDPNNMNVGSNYISEIREVSVTLSNGTPSTNKWYQFKIPLSDYNNTKNGNKKVGNIQGFKTIRFMRMFVTDFKQETYLRFATLDLVRGEWRTYTQTLQDGINQGQGSINVSAVNIEENSSKTPVNYVVPPGVKRIIDSNQSQLVEDNEQALALQVLNLEPSDARAIYKNTVYDLRRYKRLQMFTHAEELADGQDIGQNEITVFLRLGSDYKNNYYEYEIPLSITPPGRYSNKNDNDRETVWPKENMFDFPLKLLTNLKLERNKEKRKAGSEVSYTTLYSTNDPDNQQNKVSIIGNPSLSDIQVMMIGVRNNSRTLKSAEIWVNELRMTDFDEEGGWAAQGNLNINLSDIGSVSFTGRKETIGFGSIDQSLNERRSDDYSTYTIATNLDLGRFIPEKINASIPFYYSYSNQTTTPKYDPLNQDITLKESLDLVDTKAEKDSIKNLAQDKTVTKSLSFSNVKFDIKSKNPMPYDPANFTFGYAYSETQITNPTTVYDITKNQKTTFSYSYSPGVKTWEPFKNIKSKAPLAQYPKSLGINLLPSNISFNSYTTRYNTETLTRDLDSYLLGGDSKASEFMTWSQTFYWDRDFSLNWDLLRNLKISLQTGTRAEIADEPYLQIYKRLDRDEYEVWRDSVSNSIKNQSGPLSYRQTAKVTYTLPLNNIPFLSWISSSANYDSQYSWDRGATVESEEIGNIITNNITLSSNNRFDLTALYNKSAFLRKVNAKFGSNNRRSNNQRPERAKPERLKRFSQEITLNPDSGTVVNHNLSTKRIDIVARRDGRVFKVKYKRIDDNSIRIMLQDTATIQLNIAQKGAVEETTLYKVAEYAARGLMSVRSFSVNYSARNETAIEGFRPGIGDMFGQKRTEYGITPGLDFAFGLKGGEEYLNRALRNDWLVLDENNISPAVYNSTRKLELEATLEPARGLKIRLNALREKTDRISYQYYADAPTLKTLGGSFTITTISLASSFDSGNSGNGYYSKAFEKFRKNRDIITRRWENKFNGTPYPNSGFIAQAGLGNQDYFSAIGEPVNKNSSDVLIPAFLAAYTGRDVRSVSLNPFPALSALLPNWRITYDGLTTLPWFKTKFKNLILSHAYTSQYSIGSYGSFSSWIDAGNGLGFIKSLDDTPLPVPSSGYDISAVSLIEQFNPLFGAEGTMNNNLIIKARYNYTRALNLNISSFQIIENLQKDLIVGLGYRIIEFNKIMGWNKKKQSGFSNDMVINADLSRRTTQSLIRKIEDGFTEATSGTTILTLKISADYSLSKALIMRAYFDRIVNSPLISTSSYPTSNTNFGISLRFTLPA